ncbi:hypothetical protein H4R26_002374 [Coemansia thaxteri]|uniref:Uncharacterized protein n=1 Tax=Coemansia thaxteri TaxID=2663907 RepID=A0A9W8BK47_9FUNG|nr:hypothetical protein H4R26_002374 [Coemansia thaxteri]
MYLTRTVAFAIMAASFVFIVKTLLIDGKKVPGRRWLLAISVLPQNILLMLWGALMAGRTFVALDNPARDSEVMFYLLNVAPLVIASIVHESTLGLLEYKSRNDTELGAVPPRIQVVVSENAPIKGNRHTLK